MGTSSNGAEPVYATGFLEGYGLQLLRGFLTQAALPTG
jgi:hypothetical protein